MTGLLSAGQLAATYAGRCPVYVCGKPAGSDPQRCLFCRNLLEYFEHKQAHDPDRADTGSKACPHCPNDGGLLRRHADTLADLDSWERDWGSAPTPLAVAAAAELLAGLGPRWCEALCLVGDAARGITLDNSLIDSPEDLFIEVDSRGQVCVLSPQLDAGAETSDFPDPREALAQIVSALTGPAPLLYGARLKKAAGG